MANLSQEERRQRHHRVCPNITGQIINVLTLLKSFRPPTPPLRTDRPKKRRTEQSVEWLDSCSTVRIQSSSVHCRTDVHYGQLPNTSRVGGFSSTAMRLQRSRSTGRTLVATSPVKESPPMMTFAGRRGQLSSTWTSTLKRICGQLATKLGRMEWLRC